MATLFFLNLSHLSRAKGDNAVEAAALQSCEDLLDKRAGVVRSYPIDSVRPIMRKILAPADAPKWALNRAKLWNRVEAREAEHNQAKSARLAHRLKIAVPTALSDAQKEKLVLDFAEAISHEGKIVADVALYSFKKENKLCSYTIIMLTTRPIGRRGFAETKNRKYDLGAKGNIEALRKMWAQFANQALQKSGSLARIDHRTLKEQGIEPKPIELREPPRQLKKDELLFDELPF